jgi:hypothetical protein
MNRITKIVLIVIGASLLICLLAYIFYLDANNGLEKNSDVRTAWPGEVDWATAIEILHTGQVTEVMQSHNLEVTLTLEDGSQIKTIEPAIDDVFREVELCGRVCREIVLITE